MGTLVGVKLAVGVWLGGNGVEVEVGSGPICSLQAERETSKQMAENVMRIIRCELLKKVLGRKVILFCRNRDFNDKATPIYFTQFGVGKSGRESIFSAGWTGFTDMQG